MALSQDDRIAISGKIVAIPDQNKIIDELKDQIQEQIDQAQKEDNANKTLFDSANALVNSYHAEIERYDGNQRSVFTEQNLIDSVDRVLGNVFFPNDLNTPTPSIPDGAWKNYVPFSLGLGIGKSYNEDFPTIQKEQDIIDEINAQISIIESQIAATRSTGNRCSEGFCTFPQFTDQSSCISGGGVWTASTSFGPDPVMQAAGNDLNAAVASWKAFITATDSAVPTADTDSTRNAQNVASKNDISLTLSEINSWESFPNYDTTTSLPGTCSSFNSLLSSFFSASRYRDTELQVLKDIVALRSSFVVTRQSQIQSNLGSVTQNTTNGEITSATGLLGNRIRLVDVRINAIAGSLTKLKGLEKGKEAQQAIQNSNDNAVLAFQSAITASKFRSPGTNINSVHLLDASGFSVSDSVFVASNTQTELPAIIQQIDGNRVILDIKVPDKYRHTENARLYKVL